MCLGTFPFCQNVTSSLALLVCELFLEPCIPSEKREVPLVSDRIQVGQVTAWSLHWLCPQPPVPLWWDFSLHSRYSSFGSFCFAWLRAPALSADGFFFPLLCLSVGVFFSEWSEQRDPSLRRDTVATEVREATADTWPLFYLILISEPGHSRCCCCERGPYLSFFSRFAFVHTHTYTPKPSLTWANTCLLSQKTFPSICVWFTGLHIRFRVLDSGLCC